MVIKLFFCFFFFVRQIYGQDSTSLSNENPNFRNDTESYNQNDITSIFLMILDPTQLYIEINPSSISDIRLKRMSQHLQSGVIILYQYHNPHDQNHISYCPKISNNMICTKSSKIITIDQLLSTTLTPDLSSVLPAIVVISQYNPLMIFETDIVKSKRSLFYIHLEDSQDTKEIIDYFLSEGYETFWHLTPQINYEQYLPIKISSTYFLTSHLSFSLVVIPISHSLYLSSLFSQFIEEEYFFPFQTGKYSLEDYNLHYLFQLNETTQMITQFQIKSSQWIQNHWCRVDSPMSSSHSSLSETFSPLFVKNHLNALLEPPPPNILMNKSYFCELLTNADQQINSKSSKFAINIPQTLFDEELKIRIQPLKMFDQKNSNFELAFPVSLTPSGLQAYLGYYCQQLQSLSHSINCEEGLSIAYHNNLHLHLHNVQSPPFSHSHPNKKEEISPDRPQHYFDPTNTWPFQLKSSLVCAESLWCDHTKEFQRRLHLWQNPSSREANESEFLGRPHRDCESAKFLLFEPFTTVHGIGSIILQISIALRFALCHGRILYLSPKYTLQQGETHVRWMADHCHSNSRRHGHGHGHGDLGDERSLLDCYFLPPSTCQLNETEILDASYVRSGEALHQYPLNNQRVVALVGLPTDGYCSVCGSEWKGDFTFFDGLPLISSQSYSLSQFSHLKYFSSFIGKVKLPWLAEMTRYLLRPQPWFGRQLQTVGKMKLSSIDKIIPKPFASLHVRYGEKVLEVGHIPLENYMEIISTKAPHIRDIFLSTETESVIHTLIRNYPNYTFHYLNQTRHEYIHTGHLSKAHIDFIGDWISSMSNLFISIEADFFVGTLSSSWCSMIHGLQRTRGDGGRDYHSVDRGSSYTVCY